MNILALIILGLMLYNIEIKKNHEYLSLQSTTCINGIFIILVFYRHIAQYVKFNGPWDGAMNYVNANIHQLLVVPFLFYSGYGIMQSILKRDSYVKGLPTKRIIRVLIHFMIAVSSYLALGIALGKKYPIKQVLLSFIGWESLGNSNWYIFCILFMYLFTWIGFTVFSKRKNVALVVVTVLSIAFIIILGNYKDGYWFNTVMAYPLGMWIGYYKKQIDKIVLDNTVVWVLCLVGCAVLSHFAYQEMGRGIWRYQFMAICFALLLMLITMRVSIKNQALFFLGKGLFGFYMMQRFPMSLFAHLGLAKESKYVYVVVCAIATIVIGCVFNYLIKYVDNLIFSSKSKKELSH